MSLEQPISMLRCSRCNNLFPSSSFHKGKGGHRDKLCRSCRALDQRARTYDISIAQIERMFADQKGLCPICKCQMELTGSNIGDRTKRSSVHHNHKTKRVECLLCQKCNAGLGLFDDDIDKLINAVVFLRSKQAVSDGD